MHIFNEEQIRLNSYLAFVDVVVGVDGRLGAKLPTQDLNGPVGYHLIGVHVTLGARALQRKYTK